jgi:hypothetical protein
MTISLFKIGISDNQLEERIKVTYKEHLQMLNKCFKKATQNDKRVFYLRQEFSQTKLGYQVKNLSKIIILELMFVKYLDDFFLLSTKSRIEISN